MKENQRPVHKEDRKEIIARRLFPRIQNEDSMAVGHKQEIHHVVNAQAIAAPVLS